MYYLNNIFPVFIAVLLLFIVQTNCKSDCYKYGPSEFTTIVECSKGCQYSYIQKGSSQRRVRGGCSERESESCQTSGSTVVCNCKGDRCNIKGYEMDSSDSSES
ncbi:unnamed protein product [Auanema sp. JU1783]|nr:unnamed protein product [Auanema sp. JU1783]